MIKDPLELAQLIVRRDFINFGKSTFNETSALYRFTNEDITSYFEHLKNKRNILSVIGSGCQIANSILAGSENIDCFDISIFPEYFLHLKLSSILALDKEDYLKYYFSDDREEQFSDDFYDKISPFLKGKYKEFWDTLYMFDDGYDIYNSLLFRSDLSLQKTAIENNPYLQDNNYEKLKQILKYRKININSRVCDITKTNFTKEYDLVNLSNILTYYYKDETINELIKFIKENFNISNTGEIISYFFGLKKETEERAIKLLGQNGTIETLGDSKKLLVYRR